VQQTRPTAAHQIEKDVDKRHHNKSEQVSKNVMMEQSY
jgi:hypothetical protein